MDTWKPNATVAALVEHEGRYLMIEETTRDGLRLNQPAGHLEPGESLLQAVARETLEETAHHVQARALVGVYMSRYLDSAGGADITYLRFAFDCVLLRAEPRRALDHGIQRWLWLTPDEIRARAGEHRSPMVMGAIDDHLAGRRFPLDLIHTHPSCVHAHG